MTYNNYFMFVFLDKRHGSVGTDRQQQTENHMLHHSSKNCLKKICFQSQTTDNIFFKIALNLLSQMIYRP
jgi:hypothetical protein